MGSVRAGKFVTEAQTPGCWGVFATEASSQRFRTLCSDGTMLTVTHDATGQPSGQKRSARMFDPDADPVFLHSERVGNTLTFVSFNGNVYSADLSRETPVFAQPWPVVDAADRKIGLSRRMSDEVPAEGEEGTLTTSTKPEKDKKELRGGTGSATGKLIEMGEEAKK